MKIIGFWIALISILGDTGVFKTSCDGFMRIHPYSNVTLLHY
jgi:hypothetical protein